jgi:hypothetical protein
VIEVAPRTHRIASTGNAAYLVVFSLVWSGVFIVITVGLLREWSYLTILGAAVALALAVAPAYVTARLPYQATLRDDGECEFRSLLQRRRVRVQGIRSIVSDDDSEYIYIRYDGEKLTVLCDERFKALLVQLVELNPAIHLEGWLRQEVADVSRNPSHLTS